MSNKANSGQSLGHRLKTGVSWKIGGLVLNCFQTAFSGQLKNHCCILNPIESLISSELVAAQRIRHFLLHYLLTLWINKLNFASCQGLFCRIKHALSKLYLHFEKRGISKSIVWKMNHSSQSHWPTNNKLKIIKKSEQNSLNKSSSRNVAT